MRPTEGRREQRQQKLRLGKLAGTPVYEVGAARMPSAVPRANMAKPALFQIQLGFFLEASVDFVTTMPAAPSFPSGRAQSSAFSAPQAALTPQKLLCVWCLLFFLWNSLHLLLFFWGGGSF